MPELPEVETVRRGLKELIVDKKIVDVMVDWEKSFPNDENEVRINVIGRRIINIRRRAKVLLIDLDSNFSIITHLKMTGQLVFIEKHITEKKYDKLSFQKGSFETRFGAGHPNQSLVGELPDKSTRVIIKFSDNSHLYFNDQRKFGWMKLYPTSEVQNIDFFRKVGPEPLESTLTTDEFIERIRRRNNTNIKAALLDQTVIAGIGNIYADESLWLAKIHPSTLVKKVPDTSLENLLQDIKDVLTLSIKKGGSTDRNYVDAKGKRGSYLQFANVFRRDGQACPRCKTIIEKTRVAGRGTHYCPVCQRAS